MVTLIISIGALVAAATSILIAVSAGVAAKNNKDYLCHKLSAVLSRQDDEIIAVNRAAEAARTVLASLKAFDFSAIETAIDKVINERVKAKFREIEN